MELNQIYLGDAYELIKDIPDKSVDLIVTDPPYEYDCLSGAGISGQREFFNELKDSEIENFMRDLRGEAKTEKSKAEVYKSLKEKGGSDLIIKLASMPKEEREKAIADYLK